MADSVLVETEGLQPNLFSSLIKIKENILKFKMKLTYNIILNIVPEAGSPVYTQ